MSQGRSEAMRPMEERFCEEYMIDLNAAGAARRAGYAATTAATAYLWLRPDSHSYKRGVAQRIRALQEERSRRTGISADRVLQEYARIAFADIARVTDGTRILDLAGSDGHAVASIRVKGSDCDVKMYDKFKALEMLSRHLGMFPVGEVNGQSLPPLPRIVLLPDGSGTLEIPGIGGEDGEGREVEDEGSPRAAIMPSLRMEDAACHSSSNAETVEGEVEDDKSAVE